MTIPTPHRETSAHTGARRATAGATSHASAEASLAHARRADPGRLSAAGVEVVTALHEIASIADQRRRWALWRDATAGGDRRQADALEMTALVGLVAAELGLTTTQDVATPSEACELLELPVVRARVWRRIGGLLREL